MAARPIRFVIPGMPAPAGGGSTRGTVRGAALVGARRDGGETVRLSATPGEDVVRLTIVNGPTLVLHPESARDLMLAQAAAPGATRGAGPLPDEVPVPPQLGWPGLEAAAGPDEARPGVATRGGPTRGWMGRALLRSVEVIGGLRPGNATEMAAGIAAALVTQRLDGRVDPGLYRLMPDALAPLKGSGLRVGGVHAAPLQTGDGPILVLLHGTFVDTAATFGKLWAEHPDVVQRLFAHYGGRVCTLDHPTMGASPAANALTLVDALPDGAVLHLLTHSRGGLVAEVLARACAGRPSSEDLAPFAGAAHAPLKKELIALAKACAARRITVERIVRVACPARGTLLASRRLDAYLSVLKWGLELAHLPVLPELLDFLHEVARRRADPSELPGLEAMMPESPFVQWLNRAEAPLAGELAVVAGDLEGDSVGSWVKTLLADAFYWTDNDLVVQTRSMYGGTPRAGATQAGFLLDRGGRVSHFNYFSAERTVNAIADALLAERGAAAADFRPIGPLSWAGEDASGLRAARAAARSRAPDGSGAPAGARPAVIVIPGILGSNLAVDGERVWLGARFVNGLGRLAWQPDGGARITPDGPIGMVYDALIERLAASHEVLVFAYDWRRPIEDEARRLAEVVAAALDARSASGQPVRIAAHSLGGLVARTMQLERPAVWQRMMAREGARLLMLGTPNGGSWSPMQTLSGDDRFGNALAAFGALFGDAGARRVMAGMPGFLQLQAGLLDTTLGLDRADTWARLAEDDVKRLRERNFWHADDRQLAVYEWGAPPQPVLDQAVALRRRLDAQDLSADAGKLLLVVGRAPFTPAGFQLTGDGLEYLDAPDGDGRVTLASACLPGVRTFRCDASHGDLPSKASALEAYEELLLHGNTRRLEALAGAAEGLRGAGPPAAAGEPHRTPRRVETPAAPAEGLAPAAAPRAAWIPNRPSRSGGAAEPPSFASDLLAATSPPAPGEARSQALPVTVVNGNIKFVDEALMLGHYLSTDVTGSERMVNRLIGGTMADALKAGLYPSTVGSAQVFVNNRRPPDAPFSMPRPDSVIVIGLGEEGRLRVTGLAQSVCMGVLLYAQRERERGGGSGFELACTLIGSGGQGMRAGSSAQAIAQGVAEANRRLAANGWPVVTRLALVELYLDRATEAHHALAVLVQSRPREFVLAPAVQAGAGGLRQPRDSGYRGASYDFVTAVQYFDDRQQPLVEYTLDTQRARSEVRGQATQTALVDELVRVGANSDQTNAQVGRSLYQLLVPVEIRPFMSGSTAIVLQLDRHTARFPWELLDASAGAAGGDSTEATPWAVRTRVVRKLRTVDFRENPVASGRDGGVLVIGEPKADPARFAELPAAREEARAVAAALPGSTLVLQPDALGAVNALLAGPLRIVHIAGHGEYREDGSGGVVLSNGAVIGAREVCAMARVPDLVFVNCCFVGQIHPDPEVPRNALGARRTLFAASIAEELIRIGVRCVVAAGWAVEDEPAKVFALRFYEALTGGAAFIDAIGAARRAAWEANKAGNTWAAYQCYGDPDWTWQGGGASAARAESPVVSAEALVLALDTLAFEARYDEGGGDGAARKAAARLEALRQLEGRHGPAWGDQGAVAEAFGIAYRDCGDAGAAIRCYGRALAAADGGASFRAAEQMCNLLVRRDRPEASADDRRSPQAALADIARATGLVEQLVAIEPSIERLCLLGSAHKRAAEVRADQGLHAQALAALDAACQSYRRAEDLARRSGSPQLFYPAMNRIAIALRLAFLARRAPDVSADDIAAAMQSLEAANAERAEFWSVTGLVEMRMLQALAAGALADALAHISERLRDTKERVPAPSMWASVAFQARFTLEPYQAAAGAAEAAAAATLLALIDGLQAA